jgi:hypothetical protein
MDTRCGHGELFGMIQVSLALAVHAVSLNFAQDLEVLYEVATCARRIQQEQQRHNPIVHAWNQH